MRRQQARQKAKWNRNVLRQHAHAPPVPPRGQPKSQVRHAPILQREPLLPTPTMCTVPPMVENPDPDLVEHAGMRELLKLEASDSSRDRWAAKKIRRAVANARMRPEDRLEEIVQECFGPQPIQPLPNSAEERTEMWGPADPDLVAGVAGRGEWEQPPSPHPPQHITLPPQPPPTLRAVLRCRPHTDVPMSLEPPPSKAPTSATETPEQKLRTQLYHDVPLGFKRPLTQPEPNPTAAAANAHASSRGAIGRAVGYQRQPQNPRNCRYVPCKQKRPPGVAHWKSHTGRAYLEQALAAQPLDSATMKRQCPGRDIPYLEGGCYYCRQCYRCREYGCCLGGAWESRGCANCSKCRACVAAISEEKTQMLCQPKRITGLDEIPPPASSHGPKDTCAWCGFHQKHPGIYRHKQKCSRMPYKLWLARTRAIENWLGVPSNAKLQCKRCQTKFTNPKSHISHEASCIERHIYWTRSHDLPSTTPPPQTTFADAEIPPHFLTAEGQPLQRVQLR